MKTEPKIVEMSETDNSIMDTSVNLIERFEIKGYNQAIQDVLSLKYPISLEQGFPKAIEEHNENIRKLLK